MRCLTVAVTGGRDYHLSESDIETLAARLQGCEEFRHGGCRGADVEASLVAISLGVRCVEFPAMWDRHGPAAGPIRNKEMLSGCDLLIAFPGGRGTSNCKSLALIMGVEILEVAP